MKPIEAVAIILSRRLPPDDSLDLHEVLLDAAARERTRLRLEVGGTSYAVLLEPGAPLAQGEVLADATAPRLRVRAAEEGVAVASSDDPVLLMRAAWHLGNRHTPVQVHGSEVVFRPDHVLEDMVRGLGLRLRHEQRAFLPEAGAYHGASGALLRGHGSAGHGAGDHRHG